MDGWLKDKVAVITGAGGGIGRGVALDFARHGAKSAIAGFTKSIALDLGRYGITANTVAPMAATRLTVTDEVKRSLELKSEKGIRRDEFGGYNPDLLHADPLDVAPVVSYLASDL